MWRNGRAFVSRPGGGGSAARPRPRSDALHFRKGDRRPRALRHSPIFGSKNCRRIGLPSPFSPAIFGFVRRFNESLSLCRAIYRKFKPHVVLGMGGFTSTAPVLAGKMRGIPTFIHESNAIPGQGEPHDGADGARGSARVQGMRAVFSESANGSDRHADSHRAQAHRSQDGARKNSGLRDDLPTLLVMGGSQGASGINQAMIKVAAGAAGTCRCR